MKHCIIVTFKKEFEIEQELPTIQMLFEEAKKQKGIYAVRIYRNVIDMPNRADLMIVIEMEREALAAFDASVIHRKWKENYAQMIEKKTIFDTCEPINKEDKNG